MEQTTVSLQTFLPYPDFTESARSLHLELLYKQRFWVLRTLNVLHEVEPDASKYGDEQTVPMWRGHEPQLAEYGMEICEEFARRGEINSDHLMEELGHHLDWATSGEYSMEKPKWFGDMDFHLGHRAFLIRNYPEQNYQEIFADTPSDLPYIWPVA